MAESGVYGFRLGKDDAPVRARIIGLREVQRDLRAISVDTKEALGDTHRQAAEIVVMGAKRYVPYRTGALSNSIRALATKSSGRVRAGSASVPYAGPIHFGWPARRIAPQPFIYDALDERVDVIRALYEERINELIDQYPISSARPIKYAQEYSRAVRATTRTKDSGRMPEALLRNRAGQVIGGIYDGEAVYF